LFWLPMRDGNTHNSLRDEFAVGGGTWPIHISDFFLLPWIRQSTHRRPCGPSLGVDGCGPWKVTAVSHVLAVAGRLGRVTLQQRHSVGSGESLGGKEIWPIPRENHKGQCTWSSIFAAHPHIENLLEDWEIKKVQAQCPVNSRQGQAVKVSSQVTSNLRPPTADFKYSNVLTQRILIITLGCRPHLTSLLH
jgi:hypothetical protein